MTIYDFQVKRNNGEEIEMKEYEGNVLLIVNTATNCGFAPQLAELQELYEMYHERGFEVLSFPCNQFANQEPRSDEEIATACFLNYGTAYPIFQKINVKGEEAHPLYNYLTKEAPGILGSTSIKWNFTKFLIDRDGNVVKRFSPKTKPKKIVEEIEKLL
ncbi:glutathione peroxidase [Priestia taiwanensis]|uniref:Glutathione peroxidase n=1 Tax=Priestia taiwanensis TaxID=1347902 RepID=A0A917ALY6_9BACI|nr:glutathione peroxidase [Priestia taiwanensis]MBM7361899.1 glutathione peroxidase [Priestia taiwanensis]GGE57839.1 glutathione peroxidase [Priestia taiwanensis]